MDEVRPPVASAGLGRQSEALAVFERVMRVGGADWVRTYQEALAKQGYYRGAIDGANGPNTHTALVACLEAGCRVLQLGAEGLTRRASATSALGQERPFEQFDRTAGLSA